MNAKPPERPGQPRPATPEYGIVTEPGTVRFERLLPGPIERVWAYLTESELRGTWLARGRMELRVGGRVELHFRHAELSPHTEPTPDRYKKHEGGAGIHGRITRCDPPRLLSYTWSEGSGSDSEVTFELTSRDQDVLLVVTHRRLGDRATMVSVASGWHTHLGVLLDRLTGREPRPYWSAHAQVERVYETRLPAD
jgi:uncharacterized protein YndB with AHSA1/START domain